MSELSKKVAANVAEAFANHPEDTAMVVCSDGNVFRVSVINLAQEHCRRNRLAAPVTVTREQVAAVVKLKVAIGQAVDNAADRLAKERAEKEAADAKETNTKTAPKKKGK